MPVLRESKVRGVSFNNGNLIAMTPTGQCGFALDRWQERKLTNRYGETIYEDILTLRPNGNLGQSPDDFGRSIGIWALEDALKRASMEVRVELEDAMEAGSDISGSPSMGPVLRHFFLIS